MRRSPATSTTSPADALVVLGLIAALVCYLLPWVVNPGVQLTLGAYDLAEWASLHPAARAQGLITPLLLRLIPVLLVWILTLHAGARRFSQLWWLAAGTLLLSAVALLPPIEFFTQFRDDANYQQQFMLAALAFIGGLIGLSGLVGRFRVAMSLLLAGGAGVLSIVGLMQALRLMHNLGLPTTTGSGIVGLLFTLLALALLATRASGQPARSNGLQGAARSGGHAR